MSSSDDEAEVLPLSVSNYHFIDERDEPISFHVLPIQWSEGKREDGKKLQIFVRGTADNGLQKIYKRVIAWKFDLSNVEPEISILSKENSWLKLQKPRKSFEDIIRSILITVQCLHYVKRNPETSGKSIWDHLSKVFSLYEVRPSQNDLVDHISLISEAIEWDDALAKSKFLVNFLEEKPMKRKLYDEGIQATCKVGFIVDDVEDYEIVDEDESTDDDYLFDSVCAFCDNGGELLCCEGRCLRSFHPTEEEGVDSNCETLGFTKDEVDGIQNFFCKNCELKHHQCFACGKLGSSDKSSGAEVFPCVSATCGRFYHPHCIAKLIFQDNGVSAEELEKQVATGESFTCPIHKCCICKQGENKKDLQLQFAVCRRCPKSYHRKCLPSDIVFEKKEDDEEAEDEEDDGIVTRAWEGLLPSRILIYCTEHEIDEDIGTPARDHLKFPEVKEQKNFFVKKKTSVEEKNRKRTLESLGNREKSMKKKRNLSSEEFHKGKSGPIISTQKLKSSSGIGVTRKVKISSAPKKEIKSSVVGNKLFDYMKGSGLVKSGVTPASKKLSSPPSSLDAATERRLLEYIKDAASSISLEEVIKKHRNPSTHSASSRNAVERSITLGKVEGSIEAVRTALKKLEKGCSAEDSEAVCAPEILKQIFKWKNKLRVYLAPFLHGMRYTSFGRHFTKVEKLEQIADMLRWYVKDGDMIVDFCCGANDFSIIMKKKLEETGKKCLYKNYDMMQAKNDFNFEKRDWMTVQPKELPTGSRLIMGLNPPFGVKASLANQFIDKALEFNPKILILIVPPETQRLSEKKSPYDLIWEDDQCLSGKSFYLPGSVDVNDKQMDQWNVRPPPLYLWSRPDWSAKHRAIAQKQGHISMAEGPMKEDHLDSLVNDHSAGNVHHYGESPMLMDDNSIKTASPKVVIPGAVVTKGHKENSYKSNDDRGGHEKSGHGKNLDEISRSLQCGGKEKHEVGKLEISPDNRLEGGLVSGTEKGNEHSQPCNSGSSMEIETSDDGPQVNFAVDIRRSLLTSNDDPYSSLTHRWSTGPSSVSGYGATDLEETIIGRIRERSSDSLGYRPYVNEIQDPSRREADIRAQVRLYGQQHADPLRSNYPAGHGSIVPQVGSFSSTYGHGHLGPAAESSYRMKPTSAMQRYAPRLDEFNHTRMGALRSDPALGYDPCMYSSNSTFDPRAPRPGQHGGSLGFAPGPHQTYSRQNSAGWLNE